MKISVSLKAILTAVILCAAAAVTGCAQNNKPFETKTEQEAVFIPVEDILDDLTPQLMHHENYVYVKFEPAKGFGIVTEEEYRHLKDYIGFLEHSKPESYDEAMQGIFSSYEEYREYMAEIYGIEDIGKNDMPELSAVFYIINYNCTGSKDQALSEKALQRGIRALFGEDSDFPLPENLLENDGNGFTFSVQITFNGEDNINVWGWARGWGSLVDKEQDIKLED